MLTIIIPAFNEAAGIGPVLSGLKERKLGFVDEVIVVDDGSTDGTGAIAADHGARVLRHQVNMGYGASLKTGIRAARSEFVLTMDADGQHRPELVQRLWELACNSDMVVGQRSGFRQSPAWRMPGKFLLWAMANYLVRRKIPDLNSGLRLIRRDVALRYLHVCPAGFSFSTTITMALMNRGFRVSYVPIEIHKRVGKSTVSVRAGLDTIILILRIASLFDPLRVYIPASLATALAGVIWGIPYAVRGHGLSVASMLAIVTAVLLFCLGLICDQISQLRLERFE